MKKHPFYKWLHLPLILAWLSVIITAAPLFAGSNAPAKLPACGADLSQTTVSGLSSGAFMTTQFHVAYSDTIVGAGIIAGGPYYCAGCNDDMEFAKTAMTTCMKPIGNSGPDGDKLFKSAESFAAKGWIDPLSNLVNDKVYVFTGAADEVVLSKVVNETVDFYKAAQVPEGNIMYNPFVNAGHAIIVADTANPCNENGAPYINDCNFNQSHRILEHLYGDLKPPASSLSSKIIAFDQSEFFAGANPDNISMSKKAYVYIPKSCEEGKCRVHVVFHGCLQGASEIGKEYCTETGYNEMADTNNIIVLYPQADVQSPGNPEGCWDFWGYSSSDRDDPDFYKKEAPQMSAVMSMLNRLAKPNN